MSPPLALESFTAEFGSLPSDSGAHRPAPSRPAPNPKSTSRPRHPLIDLLLSRAPKDTQELVSSRQNPAILISLCKTPDEETGLIAILLSLKPVENAAPRAPTPACTIHTPIKRNLRSGRLPMPSPSPSPRSERVKRASQLERSRAANIKDPKLLPARAHDPLLDEDTSLSFRSHPAITSSKLHTSGYVTRYVLDTTEGLKAPRISALSSLLYPADIYIAGDSEDSSEAIYWVFHREEDKKHGFWKRAHAHEHDQHPVFKDFFLHRDALPQWRSYKWVQRHQKGAPNAD